MRPDFYEKPLRAVNFICHCTQAKEVSLVGDFNQWDPAANPMNQMPDRSWMLQLELKHGHHRYAFMVDGVLTLNPRAPGHHQERPQRTGFPGSSELAITSPRPRNPWASPPFRRAR